MPDYSVFKDRRSSAEAGDPESCREPLNRSTALEPAPTDFPVGGGKRARTADPLLAKQVLFQLSYTPRARDQLEEPAVLTFGWWA